MKKIIGMFAVDEDFGIGKNGTIPWKSDFWNFKKRTMEVVNPNLRNAIIMGRKTWIDTYKHNGGPLPNRVNIVVSRVLENSTSKEFELYRSLEDAISSAKKNHIIESIFIGGGARLFNYALEMGYIDEIYLTHFLGKYDCDVILNINLDEFEGYYKEKIKVGDELLDFIKYKKIK